MNGGLGMSLGAVRGFEMQDVSKDYARYVSYIDFSKEYYSKNNLIDFNKNSYGYSNSYSLKVNVAPERKVCTVITIYRSSVNCYRLCCSTVSTVEFVIFKTIGEVKEYLQRVASDK